MTATLSKPTSSATPPALDPSLKLRDIIKTIPTECFEKNPRKAWTRLVLNVIAVAFGYATIALSPWFLLPLAWIFTGTALTGFFVIAHDCGHRSFAKRRWVNDWVGHIFMLPLIYPFHGWRLLHDHHHVHTNKMDVDNAWHPWRVEGYLESPAWLQTVYRGLRGRFWWLASIAHWATLHFNPNNENVAARDRDKFRFSAWVVIGFAAIAFPTLLLTTGLWGVVKFWLLPWLVYHFWMSTFTLVHHTATDVQFRPQETWNAAEAQLAGTIHCDYPAWVEFLCHDINVHVPHHLSVAIPSYNLRRAHKSLKQNWGPYLKETQFSWALMDEITRECHIYHPDKAYQTFKSINR